MWKKSPAGRQNERERQHLSTYCGSSDGGGEGKEVIRIIDGLIAVVVVVVEGWGWGAQRLIGDNDDVSVQTNSGYSATVKNSWVL